MSDRRWAQAGEYEDHPAVKRAREALQRAAKNTPEKYLPYIMRMGNGVKVDGTRDNPVMKYVENPYMSVEGCMLWFYDDMQKTKTAYTIEPHIVECGQHIIVKTTITVHNTTPPTVVSDMASVNFGGSGVDRTNPIENASTSALGRALSRLGYGTFGGNGMATADEMIEARSRERTRDDEPPPTPPSTTSPRPASRASDRQQAFLRDLFEQLGASEADIAQNLAGITTSHEASEMITALQERLREKAQPPKEKSRQIKEVTALIAYAEQHNMTARLQGLKLEQLTAETAKELHASMRKDVSEHFARSDAGDDNWEQLYGTADAEAAQETMDLDGPQVPEAVRRTV